MILETTLVFFSDVKYMLANLIKNTYKVGLNPNNKTQPDLGFTSLDFFLQLSPEIRHKNPVPNNRPSFLALPQNKTSQRELKQDLKKLSPIKYLRTPL